jgi:hypothetical protein
MAIHTREAAATLAVLAAALAGCGGAGKGRSPTGAVFTKRANQVCSDAVQRAAALPATATQSAASQLDTYTRQNAISRDEAARLRALSPPPANRAAYAKYLADVDRRNALDDEIVTALKRGDARAAKALADQAKANDNAAQATRLGLPACAKLDAG